MNSLINRLRRLMSERQMTVGVLYEGSGVNEAYLYRILAGKVNPRALSLGILEKLARGLNVTVVELLQDPGAKDIENLKKHLTVEDKAIVDAFDLLDLDDKKRKAILAILKIILRKDSPSDNSKESCHDN